MKIILSRKGFDGNTGGFASPIMPCGRLLSLPIPVTANSEEGIPYDNLRFDGRPVSEIISQLSRNRFAHEQSHLDPDLDRDRVENRRQGWRPAFGQVGQPQALLEKVEERDLFLFFGWFRRTILADGRLRYQRPVSDLHVIFGWLQVGQRFHPVTKEDCPPGLEDHLHVRNANAHRYGRTNTVYIAADKLMVSDQRLGVHGAGTFPCFKRSLQLTVPGRPRGQWCLPRWLEPQQPNHAKWECCHDRLPFDSNEYRRRQEFVFNVPDCQEVIDWLTGLFEDCR